MTDLGDINVVLCGPTINSASYIKKRLEYLSKLASLFKSLDIVIYENDSSDATCEILEKMEEQGIIKLISEKGISKRLGLRTVIIAHGRNQLANYVRDKNQYDYMIMVDLDCFSDIDLISSIKGAFCNDRTTWDVLTGNCPSRYYDIWALRINRNQWTPIHSKIWRLCLDYDIWDMISHRSQMGKKEKLFHTKTYQKQIPPSFPLIAVTSAFNGIGIYKVSVIKDCVYNGYTRECSCSKYHVKGRCRGITCEHISFHTDIINKNNGRIFICPQLLITDQKEHWQ